MGRLTRKRKHSPYLVDFMVAVTIAILIYTATMILCYVTLLITAALGNLL